MEALETRRLLALTWDFNIIDPGGTYAAWYAPILSVMEAAGDAWAQYIDTDVTIEVEMAFFNDPGSGIIAWAAPDDLVKVSEEDGIDIVDTNAVYEIKFGVDTNGGTADAYVQWNAAFLQSGQTFVSTDPDRIVPSNALDALTTATHELGHVMGFTNLIDDITGEPIFTNPDTGNLMKTTYDDNIFFAGGEPYFVGATANAVYSGNPFGVGLAIGTIAHYGNAPGFGPSPDLFHSLMAPFAFDGEMSGIEVVDWAILNDIGLPVTYPFEIDGPVTAPPAAGEVWEIFGTGRKDIITLRYTGSHFILSLDVVGLPQTTPWQVADPGIAGIQVQLLGNDDVFVFVDALFTAEPYGVTVFGGAGDDTIQGTQNADMLYGGSGNDVISGMEGNDVLFGNGGRDRLGGGEGDDILYGGTGDDIMEGGEDDDYLSGQHGHDMLWGGDGNDSLYGVAGNDNLLGDDDDDFMDGGSGHDWFHGGSGFDTVSYGLRTGNLVVSLNDKANDGESGEGDNLAHSIEGVIGGSGNDKISGDGRANRLDGGAGHDSMDGGSGNDTLVGGIGHDKLDGGSGDDEVYGGSGNDVLVGGGQWDYLDGGTGDDFFLTYDRWSDIVQGGGGSDRLQSDEYDTHAGVEGVEIMIRGL